MEKNKAIFLPKERTHTHQNLCPKVLGAGTPAHELRFLGLSLSQPHPGLSLAQVPPVWLGIHSLLWLGQPRTPILSVSAPTSNLLSAMTADGGGARGLYQVPYLREKDGNFFLVLRKDVCSADTALWSVHFPRQAVGS